MRFKINLTLPCKSAPTVEYTKLENTAKNNIFCCLSNKTVLFINI